MKTVTDSEQIKQSAHSALLFLSIAATTVFSNQVFANDTQVPLQKNQQDSTQKLAKQTPQKSVLKSTKRNQIKPTSSIEVITTTASRNEVGLSEVPLALSVVNNSNIKNVGMVHIEEAMQLVAGANLHRGNGQEYLPALRSQVLSGAGACGGILTLEDGIPLRSAGFCNINELFEAHSEMASRIEVLKGPSSALYGSNAIHGVVNVITPNTAYDHASAGLDIGSYGYSRARVSAGVDDEAHGLGIIATVTNDTGYRDDESVKQHKVSLRHTFLPQHAALPGLNVVSGLTYMDLDQDTAGFIEGFESYKDKTIAQQNFDPDAFRQASALRLWSKINWQQDQTNISITPYARDQEMKFFKHFLPGTPLENNAQQSIGVQSLFETELTHNWQLNYGIDTELTEATFDQFQSTPTSGSPFLMATIPQGKHYDYEVDAFMWAAFADAKWSSNRWQVNIGGRFESIRYDYQNLMLDGRTKDSGEACGFGGCRYSRPASSENTYQYFSPTISVSYQLNEGLQLYATSGKGFRAPQGAELFQLQREQTIAQLEEETVTSFEVGLKGFYQQGRFLLSLYDMDKDNTIYRDSDFFTISNGQTSHQGIELEANWQVTSLFEVAFAGSHSRHKYQSDQFSGGLNINGNDIDTAPKNVATLMASYQVDEQVKLGSSLRAVSSYFTDPENLNKYEGHQVVDTFVQWQVNPMLNIRFVIKNVLDERYAERADYTRFTQDRYFPGKPRNVMLTADYQW